MNSRGFQALALVMTVLCLVSTLLQYNDPDVLPWTALYGAATLISAWAAFRPATLRWFPPVLVGLVAAVWAIVIGTHIQGGLAFADLFKTMKAELPAIEESRETLGLIIVAVWMAVLAIRHHKFRH